MVPKNKIVDNPTDVSNICRKIIQEELKDILNQFKAYLPKNHISISPEPESKELTQISTNDDMELDEPMDINLVRRPSSDITTAECRINNVIIDKVVLDEGAQSTLMSRKLARRLGLKIDTSNHLSLESVSTDSKSYGWCYNVPITFTNKSLS